MELHTPVCHLSSFVLLFWIVCDVDSTLIGRVQQPPGAPHAALACGDFEPSSTRGFSHDVVGANAMGTKRPRRDYLRGACVLLQTHTCKTGVCGTNIRLRIYCLRHPPFLSAVPSFGANLDNIHVEAKHQGYNAH